MQMTYRSWSHNQHQDATRGQSINNLNNNKDTQLEKMVRQLVSEAVLFTQRLITRVNEGGKILASAVDSIVP